jgi:hypothetical protein
VALRDEVELLVAAGARPELVVLLDHVPPVGQSRVRVHAEALDSEADPNREDAELGCTDDRRDLVQMRLFGAAIRRQQPPLRERGARVA